MNYKRKRIKAGLSFYTMAQKLGISEEKYKEVEDEKRPLEGYLIDNFYKIIQESKQSKIDTAIKLNTIKKWIDSGKALEDMKNYGYKQGELAKELGLVQSTLHYVFSGKRKVSDDVKLKVYDFLHNPINKKIKTENKESKGKEKRIMKSRKYNNKCNKELKKFIELNGIKQKDIAEATGIEISIINRLANSTKNCSEEKAKIVYDFMVNYGTPENKPVKEVKKPIEEATEETKAVVPTEKDIEIVRLSALLVSKDDTIRKLNRQISLYEKLIDRI